jgi:hypothetical protein
MLARVTEAAGGVVSSIIDPGSPATSKKRKPLNFI